MKSQDYIITSWENWNKYIYNMPRDKFNNGTLGNLQDVFEEGPKWQGKPNEELSVNYLNYYS